MTNLIGVAPETAGTTATHGVGDQYTDHDGNSWVYVQASSSLTIYDAVRIKADYKVAQLTIDTAKQAAEVGFAQVAAAIGDYLWVMQGGRPQIRLAADCDKELALYATATGGVLDDATTSSMIQGVVCVTSVTGATTAATCVSRFPTVSRSANLLQI
jgi:hypothetical protein